MKSYSLLGYSFNQSYPGTHWPQLVSQHPHFKDHNIGTEVQIHFQADERGKSPREDCPWVTDLKSHQGSLALSMYPWGVVIDWR